MKKLFPFVISLLVLPALPQAFLDGVLITTGADSPPASVAFGDSPSIDAFGRLRVSNPETLLDSKQLRDKQPLIWDEETNSVTAISTHVATNAATVMAVSSSSDFVIRQTRMRMNYQPGKSQQILMTFVLGATTPGVVRRVGYFNSDTNTPFTADYDGLYLEDDGTDVGVVVSKTGSEDRVSQTGWNLDKMDGSGPSGITLDFSKAQILLIDFEWLGVGRVRFGFVVNGIPVYVHDFNHANATTSVYMSSPNHSLRYEIRSTGGAGSLMHICSAVMSEGGQQTRGIVRSDSGDNTVVTAPLQDTAYAVHGIRLKSTALDGVFRILGKTLELTSASDTAQWEIILNPTIADTFTYAGQEDSVVETAIGGSLNVVTGGRRLVHGTVATGGTQTGSAGVSAQVTSFLRGGVSIDGTVDEVVLCIRPIAGSTGVTAYGGLLWTEE